MMADQRATAVTSAPVLPAALPVRILPFDESMAEYWDRFVLEHPAGSFFHQVGWKRVIERTFGYAPRYFCAVRGGRICGVAPTFAVSNWIMGRCLLSVPFAVYGGICADDGESEQALLHHLKHLAEAERVEHLELRSRGGELQSGFHANSRYATFRMPLHGDVSAILDALPKDIRYSVRKAEKANLRVERGAHQLDTFYRLMAINLRRLGTPVFPRALFQNLLEEFGEQVDLMVVYAGTQPLTGAMSFVFRDTMQPYYVGATPQAKRFSASDFMWWNLIKQAAESGKRCFDFGRSKKNTGAYAFKKKWKPEIESLNYQVYLVRRKSVPNFSPTNPRFELMTRLWSRIPLGITRLIGPHVVRWFP